MMVQPSCIVVRHDIAVVVDPSVDTSVRDQIVDAVTSGRGLDGLLDVLYSLGRARIPSFGCAVADAGGTRVLVRGDVTARTPDGTMFTAGPELSTWREEFVPGQSFIFDVHGAEVLHWQRSDAEVEQPSGDISSDTAAAAPGVGLPSFSAASRPDASSRGSASRDASPAAPASPTPPEPPPHGLLGAPGAPPPAPGVAPAGEEPSGAGQAECSDEPAAGPGGPPTDSAQRPGAPTDAGSDLIAGVPASLRRRDDPPSSTSQWYGNDRAPSTSEEPSRPSSAPPPAGDAADAGAHPVIRGRSTTASTADDASDKTVIRGGGGSGSLTELPPANELEGGTPFVKCASGHANPPQVEICRACSQPITDRSVQLASSIVIARLVFDDGAIIELDRPQVIGRSPSVPEGSGLGDLVGLFTIPDPQQQLSRSHIEVRLEGWSITITDLGSINGTWVTNPDKEPFRLRPDSSHAVLPGAVVQLADVARFVVEPPR